MKLLITMKLADRSLEHFIYPITLMKEVKKIIIVRDTKGNEIDKVTYYCPPNWSLKLPILALFFKFLLMNYLSIREKPVLIHGYLLFPHGMLAFLTGKLTRRKVGSSLIAGVRELFVFRGSSLGKYVYGKPLPKLSLEGKVIRAILKRFDIVTTTGNFTKKVLTNNGIEEDKIFVLPHVVDKRFKPMNIKKEYDVISIGRLSKEKHVETLIKVIGIVKKENPHIRAAILSDGPEKNKLEKISKRLDLVKNIDFVGYQPDIWNWYNKGKIFVLTSEREGFPYTVIEALSCGLPVVTSNCGDVCDIMKDGYNGIIINDYQDYTAFAEAIIKLLQNPHLINKYSSNGLKTVEKRGTDKVINIWNNIINKIRCDEMR